MSIGLPGSGIGGIFYIVSALVMPVHGAARAVRQRSTTPLRRVAGQTSLALVMVAALVLTAWTLEHLVVFLGGGASFAFATSGAVHGMTLPRVLRAASFALSFGTLAGVLVAVQLLRLFFARVVVPPHAGDAGAGTEREAA